MISTDTLLTENELAAEFVAGFAARHLAEKFFYWLPLSVRAWLELCSDGAYRNFVRSRSLIARTAADLAQRFAPEPPEVLTLAPAHPDKPLLLLTPLPAPAVP